MQKVPQNNRITAVASSFCRRIFVLSLSLPLSLLAHTHCTQSKESEQNKEEIEKIIDNYYRDMINKDKYITF